MNFSEISEVELMEIDGGKVSWKRVITTTIQVGWALFRYNVTHPIIL